MNTFCCSDFRGDPLEMASGLPRIPDCLLGFMKKTLGDWQDYHKLLGAT